VRLLARVIGVGIETADMLVHEVLSRNMRFAAQLRATTVRSPRTDSILDWVGRIAWV